jgi:prepilin-type N-terminal cleavage/methylation domain-containing protein/prepilin-type processing-associated H-X9-DG protein
MILVVSSSLRKAFTLIELLVVIAIIAILAAILFPVFAKVREKARAIACVSNEKQIGLAFTQYIQDNDEKFPCGNFTTTNGNHLGWVGQVQSYTKSNGLFRCPDDPDTASAIGAPVSYSFNNNLANLSQASANAPSNTVLAYEVANTNFPTVAGTADITSPAGIGVSTDDAYTPAQDLATGPLGSPTVFTPNTAGRHTDGSNFLAADGHSKYLRGTSVSPGATAASATDAQNAATAPNPTAAGTSYSGTTSFALTFSPS